MELPDIYGDRPQTFFKHEFLRQYLRAVASITLSSWREFTYVDGFSGPWRARDEEYSDTSFSIALNELQAVKSEYERRGREVHIRCLFIEKDAAAFAQLNEIVTSEITNERNLQVRTVHGEFERSIDTVVSFVGDSFSFVFIDPTGWTGFDPRIIGPILKLRGEVVVNLMFDHVNRFLDDDRPEVRASFERLFGDPDWRSSLRHDLSREHALIECYKLCLKRFGDFRYVFPIQVRRGTTARTNFYLFYTTRNIKGLTVARDIEAKIIAGQASYQQSAKRNEKFPGQATFDFGSQGVDGGPAPQIRERASARLAEIIRKKSPILYDELLGDLLEEFSVCEKDIRRILRAEVAAGRIRIEGLRPAATTPKVGMGHRIVQI